VARSPGSLVVAVAGLLLSAACGHDMTGPTGPGPALACPAGAGATSKNGQSVLVAYAAPTISGGTAPYTAACLPASGSPFAPGATTVTCSVADADHRAASCSFTVIVVVELPTPMLSVTKFVAFGDSLTESKLADRTILDLNSYPNDLKALLSARYTTQTFAVVKEGCGGEPTFATGLSGQDTCPGGIVRLPEVLARDAPQVLLLLEGSNDVMGGASTIPTMIANLKTMVQQGKNSGAIVFIATLPPERNAVSGLIPVANMQIAQIPGANVVDLFAGLGGSPDPYVGSDGLHLTIEGYQQMAQTFFAAIKAALETPPMGAMFSRPGSHVIWP
jgi:lysophospholipase L1-like esterase